MIVTQRKDLYEKTQYSKDLEEYIDKLLVRVIEIQPRILQTPFPSPTTPPYSNPYMTSSTGNIRMSGSQSISSGVTLGINRSRSTELHPGYPPPAYYSAGGATVVQNNNRNQQQSRSSSMGQRSRVSPPKLIRAGQQNNGNAKKERKSNNPFKKLLKN